MRINVFDDGIWNTKQRNGQQAKSSLKHDSKKKPEIYPKGVVNYKAEVNLQLMVFKRGLVHIYINNGNMD
jgi:hypothetical protein